jgi:hypothetical protein
MKQVNTDKLSCILPVEVVKELNGEIAENTDKIELYQKVLQNLELFLTYWYKNSKEFQEVKESFNEHEESCTLRLKDDKIKIDINWEHEANQSAD